MCTLVRVRTTGNEALCLDRSPELSTKRLNPLLAALPWRVSG